jgi:hypothetical protein
MRPKEKYPISQRIITGSITLYTTEDDLELLMKPHPEWVKIWENN